MALDRILDMIDAVDPEDTRALDEIDVTVHEYLGFFSYWKSKHDCYNVDIKARKDQNSFRARVLIVVQAIAYERKNNPVKCKGVK